MVGNTDPKQAREELAKFLKKAYAAFVTKETNAGRDVPSQVAFANWLDVPQSSFSNWIQGQRPPDQDNLDKLAAKLGPEVYRIFGKPARVPDDPLASWLYQNWHNYTPEERERIIQFARSLQSDQQGDTPSNFSIANPLQLIAG